MTVSAPTTAERHAAPLPWLGTVPEGWVVAPLGSRYEIQLGQMLNEERAVGSERLPYLRNVNVQWDRFDLSDVAEMTFSAEAQRKFRLRRGDLLVCEGGEVGRAAVWNGELDECYYQKALHRLRPRGVDDPRYLMYLLWAAAGIGVFAAEGHQSTIIHLTAEMVAALRVPFPPPASQRRIATWLDQELARFDGLVAAKRLLRERLIEQRAGLVAAAVAGRLGETRRKATTIPWLPSVPETWRAARLKYVAHLGTGHTPSRQHPEWWDDCTIPWITTGDVHRFRDDRLEVLEDAEQRISELGLANSAAELHPRRTVVLSRTASVGFSAIMGQDMATSQDFATWTCSDELLPEFLLYCLRAMRPDLLGRLAQGSTHQTIYMPDIERIMVPLPPITEQQFIVSEIRRLLAPIDRLLSTVELQLPKLVEYRRSLVTTAVSGNLGLAA